jgi:hypothetical protein
MLLRADYIMEQISELYCSQKHHKIRQFYLHIKTNMSCIQIGDVKVTVNFNLKHLPGLQKQQFCFVMAAESEQGQADCIRHFLHYHYVMCF